MTGRVAPCNRCIQGNRACHCCLAQAAEDRYQLSIIMVRRKKQKKCSRRSCRQEVSPYLSINNVADFQAYGEMFKDTISKMGHLDIPVNNAGI